MMVKYSWPALVSMMTAARELEPGSRSPPMPVDIPDARAACMMSDTAWAREVTAPSPRRALSSSSAIRVRHVSRKRIYSTLAEQKARSLMAVDIRSMSAVDMLPAETRVLRRMISEGVIMVPLM